MNAVDFSVFNKHILEPRVKEMLNTNSTIVLNNRRYKNTLTYYNQYENTFNNCMNSPRLDRHKMAACMCLAVCKARPFGTLNDTRTSLNQLANEYLALQVSIDILESFIRDDMVKTNPGYSATPKISFPAPIQDEKSYESILVSCLHYSHMADNLPHPWWLSQVFYFLEVYTREKMTQAG
ncbi:MAG: hypothetical protein FWB88_11520 [Defluviitaleaceae bacterium]|nr:hypothetical protein [Defluviitaleaceae bacterium]MCL2240789.1 hypothetical protein [Defluviitaleaceae bacterium]